MAERFRLFGEGATTLCWYLEPEFNSYPNMMVNHMLFDEDVFLFGRDGVLSWTISMISEKTVIIVSIWMTASEICSVAVRAPIRGCEVNLLFLVSKHIINVSLSIPQHNKSP